MLFAHFGNAPKLQAELMETLKQSSVMLSYFL